MEQLAWTYASCATPPKRRFADAAQPASLFPALRHELFSGVLEFISNGRMSYFHFEDGKFLNGYYCGKPDEMTVPQYVESLFHPSPDGTRPQIAAAVFPPLAEIPGVPAAGRVVLCVGPLEMNKGYYEAVWAFDILRYPHPDLHLVLAGDGPAYAHVSWTLPGASAPAPIDGKWLYAVGAPVGNGLDATYFDGADLTSD